METASAESHLIKLYGVAALQAREEIDLDKVAEIWGGMVAACDVVILDMEKLRAEHASESASLNRILDIRDKSARLRELHL